MSEFDEWEPPKPPRDLTPLEVFAVAFFITAAFFCGLLFGMNRP